MPVSSHQIEAAAEALATILKFDQPADLALRQFFAQRRDLGSHDRAFVAESVFGVLRHKRMIDHLAPQLSARRTLLAYLARIAGASMRELESALRRDERAWIAKLKGTAAAEPSLAVRADLPDWVVDRLRPEMSDAEILALGRALQQPAPFDLRVNTVRGERDAVLRELAADGIRAAPTPYSPVGIRVEGHPAINHHALFKRGVIEVQDEGSQLVSLLVAPTRHDLVVDFCAGAGGKALMLGAMMQSHGRVYAFDVSEKRLARLRPRLKRSGLTNLHPYRIQNENDIKVKRLAGKIDCVLVDAPCSGLGTVRRNPDLKWRQSPQTVCELKARQRAILEAAGRLVKPGGRLVYATCSLLPEENEAIVDGFLANRPDFERSSCADVLRRHSTGLDTGRELRLLPHRHGTDGFFAALLVRRKCASPDQ